MFAHYLQLSEQRRPVAQRSYRGGATGTIQQEDRLVTHAAFALFGSFDSAYQEVEGDHAFSAEEKRFLGRWLYQNREVVGQERPLDAARRVLRVAELVRSRDTLPALLEVVRFCPDNESERRLHDGILTLLAEVTGWNARLRADGSQRTRDQTTGAFVEACGPLWLGG